MSITAVAIDLGGTFIKYGLIDRKGAILWESKISTPAQSHKKVIDSLIDCVNETRKFGDPCCIGIGTPGMVDVETGRLVGGAPQIKDWSDLSLAELISEQVSLPVYVDNDANLMGLGEYRFGKNNECRNLIFLTIGTGIGGALILDGNLYRGSFFAGGEFGYIPYDREGISGYWEDFGSTGAMVDLYKQLAGISENVTLDGKEIIRLRNEGNEIARKSIEKHLDALGFGIAGLISILNPDKVIVGGGISESGPWYIEGIKSHVSQYVAPECYQGVDIEAAMLGNRAGFLGAGYYALRSEETK